MSNVTREAQKPGRTEEEKKPTREAALKLRDHVCGGLLTIMQIEARQKVLRWAEMDFGWFDADEESMEITLGRAKKKCYRCEDDEEGRCEESIVLKVWKTMEWKRIRRRNPC